MFKNLKITYLLESTNLWGGTKVVLEQAEALAEAGCNVVILSKGSYPMWYPLKLPIVQVSDFNASAIPDSDIIIGTYWTTVDAAYKSCNGNLVHFCQGYEGGYKELSHLKERIDKVYSYDIPKLTISPHIEGFLKERFKSETYYIGQMLDRSVFYPERKKKIFRWSLFRRFCQLKILIVGPFEVSLKNIAIALTGVRIAKERFKIPIKLIRVSQFPLIAEETKIIKPDSYHYHVPSKKMGGIYRNADLLISMSDEAEGFGLPALEAMACGVPTILSRIPSYLSLDDKSDYTIFIDPSDYEALAKAIERLYYDENLKDYLTQRGLAVAAKFTKEAVIERLRTSFDSILYKQKL